MLFIIKCKVCMVICSRESHFLYTSQVQFLRVWSSVFFCGLLVYWYRYWRTMLVILPVHLFPSSVFLNLLFPPLLMPYPLFHHNFKPHRFFKGTSHKSHIPAFITKPLKLNLSLFVWDRFYSWQGLYQHVPVPLSCYRGILNLPIFVWNYPLILLIIPENIYRYIKPVVFEESFS